MLATPRTIRFEGESIREFLKGFRSEATKDSYTRKLRYFLEYVGVGPDEFLARTKQDPRWAEHMIIDYVEARRNQVSGSTISQVRDALKHFYAMNDLENGVNWAKIVRMMPRAKKVGSDRAPTVEEVRRMVESADLRLKCDPATVFEWDPSRRVRLSEVGRYRTRSRGQRSRGRQSHSVQRRRRRVSGLHNSGVLQRA